jgi:hypothetical protein
MGINNISIWTKIMVDPIGGGTFSQLLNTINRNRSSLQNSLERILRVQLMAGLPEFPIWLAVEESFQFNLAMEL